MRLLHATAEAEPFAKTGGLADVLGALPRAQAATGHDVLVVHPWYASLRADPPPLWIGDVAVPFDGGEVAVGVGTLEVGPPGARVRYAFVGHDAFRRDALYGYPDDAWRFALFARSLPVVAHRVGFLPDVVHVHDWHAALVPAILRHGDALPEGFRDLPTVLTVHNAQYQGHADAADVVRWVGVPGSQAGPLALHGRGNFLHAGLQRADRVTTVSPSYARELLEPDVAYGLDAAFAALGPRLRGVLNGLDEVAFDPAHDPHLAAPFSPSDLEGKADDKRALARELGLEAGRPLLGVVSRLADQKGIDLLLDALPDVLAQGWDVALLGSGDPLLEEAARAAFVAHAGRVGGRIGYDDGLARRIYAGADALAIPSRFEPCGLAQMIAMRYATVPVARATGGLADTIDDGRTGFLFAAPTPTALTEALARARRAYDEPDTWAALRHAAVREHFGWDRSVRAYDGIYRELVDAASAHPGGPR